VTRSPAVNTGSVLTMGLLVAVFGLVYGLPSMVLAWRMPADLADDE
jgi:hypothetical protein